MTYEKWQEVKGLLKDKFKILSEDKEELNPGRLERVVFLSSQGKMKLEWIEKPKVIDRKVYASRRIGSPRREELIYSPDEKISFIKAYRFDDQKNEWQEIEYNI